MKGGEGRKRSGPLILIVLDTEREREEREERERERGERERGNKHGKGREGRRGENRRRGRPFGMRSTKLEH